MLNKVKHLVEIPGNMRHFAEILHFVQNDIG
jgi:hypothetical protein